MKILTRYIAGGTLVLMTGLLVAGCDGKPQEASSSSTDVAGTDNPGSYARDKNAHQHPETFAEAVSQLGALRDTIRDGFARGDADAAHGPLHDVGHVLNEVKALAAKEIADPEQLATINEAVESLFASFGAVDAMMHKKDGKQYSEVSDDVDSAMQKLQAAVTVDSDPDTEAEASDSETSDPEESDDDESSEPKQN